VAAAGLFTRSLIEALTLNRGIATDGVFTASLVLGPYGYTEARATVFVDELRQRLQRNGAIESVSISQAIGGAQAGVPVVIDGVRRELPSGLLYTAVTNNYFSTRGPPNVNGRSFARSDIAGSPPVAVVSESLGRLIAGGGNPIGHRLSDFASMRRILTGQGSPDYAEVIGVVPDLITNVNATGPLVVYQPVPPDTPLGLGTTLVVRAVGNPSAAMRETMAAARALDSRVTLGGIMTLDEQLARQMNPQRFGIYILGALGSIALLLTVLGTNTIAESTVVRRHRELGIRAALGAGTAQLRHLVFAGTARLVGIGLVAGLALAVLGARLIRSLLHQVQPLDPWVLATGSAIILDLSLLVSLRPALEATRLDLTRSLRQE
jgi:hypothetical protein